MVLRQAPDRPPPPPVALAVVADMLAIAAALVLALLLRGADPLEPIWALVGGLPDDGLGTWDQNENALLLFQLLTIPPLLHVLGQYRLLHDPRAAWSTFRVNVAVDTSFAALLAILFALQMLVPRLSIALDFLLVLTFLMAWRWVFEVRQHRRHRRGEGLRNVLFVGDDPVLADLADLFQDEPLLGRRIAGHLVQTGGRPVAGAVAARVHEAGHFDERLRLERPQDLESALDGLLPEEVYIGPDVPTTLSKQVLTQCRERGIDIHFVPKQGQGVQLTPWTLGGFSLLEAHRRPMSRLAWIVKRGMDVAGGLVGLAIGTPIMILVAIAIKLEDRRLPVFYSGMRVGYKGRLFRMAKFTTMRRDAQELEAALQQENTREGPWFKLPAQQDPRLTRVGRIIRKFSLNEIPQFWNVLRGDMSLVGPRPPLPDEVASYIEYDSRYFRCLDVKPGITGLWQVTAKEEASFDRRIELDLEYINGWSIGRDVVILLKTLWVVIASPEE